MLERGWVEPLRFWLAFMQTNTFVDLILITPYEEAIISILWMENQEQKWSYFSREALPCPTEVPVM